MYTRGKVRSLWHLQLTMICGNDKEQVYILLGKSLTSNFWFIKGQIIRNVWTVRDRDFLFDIHHVHHVHTIESFSNDTRQGQWPCDMYMYTFILNFATFFFPTKTFVFLKHILFGKVFRSGLGGVKGGGGGAPRPS